MAFINDCLAEERDEREERIRQEPSTVALGKWSESFKVK